MNRIRVAADPRSYLASDPVVDFDHPLVRVAAERLSGGDTRSVAKRCFEFVRDTIEHSFDHRRSPTTLAASEVLASRTGYCYAKAHLLVALLRSNGLPSGFCYQRLTVEGTDGPHCLHGFVAVDLGDGSDYALDPRGNKPGVDARFEPPTERLAFAIQHAGEFDAPFVYPRPLAVVVRCLREHRTWDAVLANLPDVHGLGADAELA